MDSYLKLHDSGSIVVVFFSPMQENNFTIYQNYLPIET